MNDLLLEGSEWSASCCSQFSLGKEAPYPLNMRGGWSQSWPGHFGEEINLLPMQELNHGFSDIQPVSQLVCQLCYLNSLSSVCEEA